ncbi:hypothetical protein M501DRAFT_934878 [Patellaria atrata CBS 101060]|uniref:Uncharacterized protein n=1 Tax=Patellaria atrata CBS 101060 TaxID=1346257 RepID=A0A9P4SA05_9PEZI|nr:hypothetical protein M501DRAFT_934878 [Patellaria atrata CBS 101060]
MSHAKKYQGRFGSPSDPDSNAGVRIVDIRSSNVSYSITDDVHQGLKQEGEKALPTLLLYDETGLRLFEKITYLDEYYLTNAETEVLSTYADRIAQRIKPGSIVLELGSGNLRKVSILLQAFENAKKPIEYYALDLNLNELQRTLEPVSGHTFRYVQCFGLHGTYDDGYEWLKSPGIRSKPKSILTLGSSIGNFNRPGAAQFLSKFVEVMQESDTLLVGIDSCKDSWKVYHAYNDKINLTHEFILNGLRHANRLLGDDAFVLKEWSVIGEYDSQAGRHQAFVSPIKDVTVCGILIKQGERVRIEESYKYSPHEIEELWRSAGLVEGASWYNRIGDYGLHMVSGSKVSYSLNPQIYASKPFPGIAEWLSLWAAWDVVTQGMIPNEELLSKPIKLRNACIFYLGHIPTFMDIHITRATEGQPSEPNYYAQIFERGIDPDVENPELCHAHSEIPDSWPPVAEILGFQTRVRERVKSLYEGDELLQNPKIRRALWLGFEHEIMHLETLLYMLVQSEKTLPPPGTVTPDFEAMAFRARSEAVENEWFTIPESGIVLGIEDAEDDVGPPRYFGWDNEKPKRAVHVSKFEAKARAITNAEFLEYLQSNRIEKLPASWVVGSRKTVSERDSSHLSRVSHSAHGSPRYKNGGLKELTDGKFVRTVYGLVPLEFALDWPVSASYDEISGCAKWMGGRIPTMEETRSIYAHVERLKRANLGNTRAQTIPAVNGHLVNDGVEETPPSDPLSKFSNTVSGLNPHELFVNLEGANVGFRHWHPVSIVQKGNNLAGQGELGGVWEWTSSVLERYEGFQPMKLYPAYTADFFDTKHNIVLGGSWATHPRIAGRKSFVNWYQRNYPYVWAGARLVRDI